MRELCNVITRYCNQLSFIHTNKQSLPRDLGYRRRRRHIIPWSLPTRGLLVSCPDTVMRAVRRLRGVRSGGNTLSRARLGLAWWGGAWSLVPVSPGLQSAVSCHTRAPHIVTCHEWVSVKSVNTRLTTTKISVTINPGHRNYRFSSNVASKSPWKLNILICKLFMLSVIRLRRKRLKWTCSVSFLVKWVKFFNIFYCWSFVIFRIV